MIEVYPASWIAAFINAEKMRWVLYELVLEGLGRVAKGEERTKLEDARAELKEALETLIQQSKGVPLSDSLLMQINSLMDRADEKSEHIYTDYNCGILNSEAELVMKNIMREIHGYLFFAVSHDKRKQYEDPRGWFGITTIAAYPDIDNDVRGACHSFVFDLWTASVFHCMCVLEIGLRALARKLRVKLPKPVDYTQWGELIQAIETEIRARKNPQKKVTSSQRKRNQWYSEMATNFSHVNSAWRTHANHARGSYDEQQANEVLNHVRSFMRVLVAGPS